MGVAALVVVSETGVDGPNLTVASQIIMILVNMVHLHLIKAVDSEMVATMDRTNHLHLGRQTVEAIKLGIMMEIEITMAIEIIIIHHEAAVGVILISATNETPNMAIHQNHRRQSPPTKNAEPISNDEPFKTLSNSTQPTTTTAEEEEDSAMQRRTFNHS